jgi:hypothetical protein
MHFNQLMERFLLKLCGVSGRKNRNVRIFVTGGKLPFSKILPRPGKAGPADCSGGVLAATFPISASLRGLQRKPWQSVPPFPRPSYPRGAAASQS